MSGQKNSHVDLIDSLLADCKKPEDLVGEHGLLKQMSQALTERALTERALTERALQVESAQTASLQIRKFDHDCKAPASRQIRE